jgi:hypothetical protein
MLVIAILFILLIFFLICYNKQEHFTQNLPIDIHKYNRNLIKNELDTHNVQSINFNFDPIDNELIYRADSTTSSNTFLAKDLENILKGFIIKCDHNDKYFIELNSNDTINKKRFEIIVDKILNMFQNAIHYNIFIKKQFKYIMCPNINSCRLQLIDKKIIKIKRYLKNNDIERWNIIIEFYITGKTNSFVLETFVEYFKGEVLLLNIKIIGKNSDSRLQIPDNKSKSDNANKVQPYYYREPQLNIFRGKNTKYNTKNGYHMNNEIDNITLVKTQNKIEQHIQKYLSRQRIGKTSNNFIEDQYKCYGSKGNNQTECENNYDNNFKSKNRGIWDTPCKNDIDCPFYRLNKNYKNNFGGCVEGVCEMPMGINRLGNKYYDIDTKPLCHNCPTNNRDCCDKQENPDYIFKDDIYIRKMNEQELNQKGLRLI